MKWASVSATEPALDKAVAKAADKLLQALGGREPDLVLAFVTPPHQPDFVALPGLLRKEFESAVLVGALGAGAIGGGTEYEDIAAVTLTGAVLPQVSIHATHVVDASVPPLYAERSLWQTALQLHDAEAECFLVLAEPFEFDTPAFLRGLDRHFPHIAKLGGLAAGIEQAGPPCLLLNDRVHVSGALCIALSGNIHIDTIVAQGCRPVGEPMFANNTHENLLLELDGRTPRDVLTDVYSKLPRQDRQLFTDALFLGIALEQQREQYHVGDFLIRSILGLDPQSGALWVNAPVPLNRVVQFHLRDAETSTHELELVLQGYRASDNVKQIAACLLFACTQRGTGFYGHADHDSNAFRQFIGDVPIGGFFCNGEIGPVNGGTYLHGYTSVFGIVRSKPLM